MQLSVFEQALIGLQVSHVWRGHGSALFVEFGCLGSPQVLRNGVIGNPCGEITLMIEWSWRIEKARSIMCGSWSSERKWPAMFDKLKGARVLAVRSFGVLPEIEVSLSSGLRIVSFMTAEGQPAWGLISRLEPKGCLGVRRGRLHFCELPFNSA